MAMVWKLTCSLSQDDIAMENLKSEAKVFHLLPLPLLLFLYFFFLFFFLSSSSLSLSLSLPLIYSVLLSSPSPSHPSLTPYLHMLATRLSGASHRGFFLSFQVLVGSITSLLKTVKSAEDTNARGLRALESAVEAIDFEMQQFSLVLPTSN